MWGAVVELAGAVFFRLADWAGAAALVKLRQENESLRKHLQEVEREVKAHAHQITREREASDALAESDPALRHDAVLRMLRRVHESPDSPAKT